MQFCEATGLIGQIAEVALNIISSLGYLGAVLIVMVENVLPFIPSEVILPAIGFATIQNSFLVGGVLGIIISIILVTFASVLGAVILFLICRKIGVHNIAKIPFVKEEELQKAERAFEKHGAFAVFICRIIPVVRVLVTIPAGLSNMKLKKFITFTLLGSLIWNTILVSIGSAMGVAWCSIEPVFSKYSKVTIIVAVVIILIAYFIKHKLSKKS